MSPVMRRVVAAFGAHSYGQAISIFTQLASLPLFLGTWDTATYGVWLMLIALPTYLSISDGGLVTAASNEIAIASARKEYEKANGIFQSGLAFLSTTCTSVFILAALLIYVAGIPGVSNLERKNALMALAAGVLIAQFHGLGETIFRACGKHAIGIFLGNTSRLMEWIGWMVGLTVFKSFEGVAMTGVIFRALVFGCTFFLSRKIQTTISWSFDKATKAQVRALLKPAASFMSMTLSNALSIQGVTLLVGHLLGPATVTIFNTYRTLSRVALQVTSTLGNSLWAEFSRLHATGGIMAIRPFFQRASRVSVIASVGLSTVLFIASPTIIEHWSRNQVNFDLSLMFLMLGLAAISGSWNVARVLLMSINSHITLSRLAIAAAIGSVSLAYVLGSILGLTGVAAGLVFVETSMATACIVSVRKRMNSNG